MSLLRVEQLHLRLGPQQLLAGIDLEIAAQQRCALLGPSGSGKTLLLRSLFGLRPPGAELRGTLHWEGGRYDLADGRIGAARAGLGLVFQGAGQALHPLRTLGDLLTETARLHGAGDPRELLQSVGLIPVENFWQRRPDQLSGGQRQRALIALSLAARPRLLLADEPTAALDSVARAQILQLLRELCRERGLGLLLVAHDPLLLRQVCEQALVLVDGQIVERAALSQLFADPQHAWTRSLVAASARLGRRAPITISAHSQHNLASGKAVLKVTNLAVNAPPRGWRRTRAPLLCEVGFAMACGQRVALMGASGSGKSTLGRCLVGLAPASAGSIDWPQRQIRIRRAAERAATVQMVLQDSRAALNPMHSIATSLLESARVHRKRPQMAELESSCELAGVDPSWLRRRPSTLSGGQCQRVALARALIAEPQLLILDEALCALDPPLRADLVDRLESLSDRLGLAMLLITHDFSESRRLCQRAMVLSDGRLVEDAPTASVEQQQSHPATRALIDAWREQQFGSAGDVDC